MCLSTPAGRRAASARPGAAARSPTARARPAARSTTLVLALWSPWATSPGTAAQAARALLAGLAKASSTATTTSVSTAPAAPMEPAAPALPVEQWQDRFTELRDRVAAPPLPLPAISSEQEVTLVRHGQSTWNAESRVQGSSDESVLTDKGVRQAQQTRDLLASTEFSQLWFSPLARASQTAQLVWNGRVAPQHCDPVLREIDLYLFQGLLKPEVKERFAMQHYQWHHKPDEFELAGHFPVHETWYRASLAWQKMLPAACEPGAGGGQPGHTLVVAHNNINQALLAVALQLPVSFFRRLVQCNAAVSRLHFTPAEEPGQPPEAKLLCLNQSTASPLKRSSKMAGRVVLVVASEDAATQQACAALLADTPVAHVLALSEPGSGGASSAAACAATASALVSRCRSDQEEGAEPDVMTLMQQAGNEAWQSAVRLAGERGGCTVAVVLGPQAAAGLTCSAFGLGQLARPKFHFEPGGVSVFEFAAQPGTVPPMARCINSRAHLVAPTPAASAAPAGDSGSGGGSSSSSSSVGTQELQ